MSDVPPLARALNRADVVAVNLGAMLGTGVFVVVAPPPRPPVALGCWPRS
jgi:hypothetical protein